MNKQQQHYDLCVIGGGINGAGIARDAALRGLSVLLLEMNDLASATSSASTKLVHGGLRYLEFYEFSLVRESLQERERLMGIAPHIIWPLSFVLPHHAAIRPLWMIRAGLFLYDFLGGRRKRLPSSRYVALKKHDYGAPLKDQYAKGFSYADCWVQDSRLVILNAMDAQKHGATVLTRHKVTGLKGDKTGWNVSYRSINAAPDETDKTDGPDGPDATTTIRADMVVNAAGPWAEHLLQENGFYAKDQSLPHLRLVKGSHIVLPRQYDGDQAYILQQKDGRIVFAIPYETDFTLVGTTDEPVDQDSPVVCISDSETAYLCNAYNDFFKKAIAPSDVVWSFSGVRALLDDGEDEARAVTRDYKIYHHDHYAAPMLSIFGGKITTYRKLAKQTVDRLMQLSGRKGDCMTGVKPLPGGDIEDGDMDFFMRRLQHAFAWLPEKLLRRYAVHYGTCVYSMLSGATSFETMGRHFGDGVYECEIRYLLGHEFAENLDDILWRRTKLGLHISEETKRNIENFIRELKQ
ncbi:MAG: glycerol-3-phosphate dehydrogenase [Micavibrio sp.]|nr:glycerol-3-phosphate dehydrogenase [Micavibrio sp.]